MARFKLTLEYDGSKYKGWQVQKGQKTIQGAFFDALKDILGQQKFEFYGSGRTDAGVHALSQVAHLDTQTKLSADKLFYAINDRLPGDIALLKIENAPNDFHARHAAKYRSYVYVLSARRSAFGKSSMWWIKDKLNFDAMLQSAKMMEGMHDFRSFTDPDGEHESTKVEVKWVDIHKKGDLIYIHIVGSHFLWKMVRRIVGVLVEVGRGKMDASKVKSFLTKHSTEVAQYTAPPQGLYFHEVYYQADKVRRGVEVCPNLLNM